MAADPRRVKELFVAVLDLPDPQARQAFLERECGDDADLRQRLEALLKAHENPASALNQPLAEAKPDAEPAETGLYAAAAEQPGTLLAGRYKLLEQISEGGMGAVWVAEQMQPVRRKVAVKLVKAGMDSKAVLSRFEAERQALALMDHRHVAKVLDGGTTESGRPFFVMEYVKGVSFSQYCDNARLSIAERLALFVPVCQAVQHAHQKGIIHRDLKPSNILVCLYDGKPVPKVIDFGLAKAIHQPLTEHTLHTGHGVLMGTPLYMSPEQAEFNNLDVDTRTDIYALGVVLYELLTGTTPLEKQRFKQAAWQEMLRVIKEEEPPRPSARLSGSGSLPSLAAQRQLEPVKLTKLVRGELDWIVMKCLEKDRSRRYDTANGLARDVERYLADEVVEARPASVGYRLRKFVRRHRAALAMAATVVLLLVAGVAVSTWQAVRAIEAERDALALQSKAQQEEQKALKSAAEARAMISFFKELTLKAQLAAKDPDGKFRDRSMDEALAIIDSEKVRALFAAHPLAEAEIREWIAVQVWPTEGQFARAIGEDDPMDSLGIPTVTISKGVMSHPRKVRYDRTTARRHLERAVELRSVHLGPNDRKTLETVRQLGRTLLYSDTGKAFQVLSDGLARNIATFGPDDELTLRYQGSLATAYEVTEKPEEAVRLWKDVYTRSKAKWGRDSNEALERSYSLAATYEKAGRVEEALRQQEESLRCLRKLATGSVDRRIAQTLKDIARLYERIQDYTRAEALWRECLLSLKDWDDDGISEGVQASLGVCLLRNGKPADAEPILRACLAIRAKKRPDDLTTFHTKSMLGGSLLGQKKYAEAEPLLQAGYEGMSQREANIPQQDKVRLTEALERLVQLYDGWGRKDKADGWRKKWEAAKAAAKPLAEPR